jgi:hypothetical protein
VSAKAPCRWRNLRFVAAERPLDVSRSSPGHLPQPGDVFEEEVVICSGEQAAAVLVDGEGVEHGAVGNVLLELANSIPKPAPELTAARGAEPLFNRLGDQ